MRRAEKVIRGSIHSETAPDGAARFSAEHVGARMRRGAADSIRPDHAPDSPSDSGRARRRAWARIGACVGLCGRAGPCWRMSYVRAHAPAKGRCIECGGATARRANALRCVPCALAARARRNRAARAVEIAKRAPRACAACCGRAIVGRAAQARHCIECVRYRGPQPDRHCVDCGVNMGKRRSDARRCRTCARALATERMRAWRAKVARAAGRG